MSDERAKEFGLTPPTGDRAAEFGLRPPQTATSALGIPIATREAREQGIAHPPPEETAAQRFRRGFSEGFGEGAPLGGGPLDIVTQPARAGLAGLRGLTRGVQEVLPRDVAALPEAFAGSATGIMGHVGVPGQASEALFPGAAAATKATMADKARSLVEKTLGKSIAGGETTAVGILDQIGAARQAGQPLTLSDIGGVPIRRLAGSVYRSGGEAASHMKQFYEGRGTALEPDQLRTVGGARLEKAIGQSIATGSYKEASEALAAARSEEGRPLWAKAMEGGSLAPLEHQFGVAFNEASAAEQAALRDLATARNQGTQAAARQSQAGNVYAASGANRAAGEGSRAIKDAEARVTEARATADKWRAQLRRAQDDGTANAPGAVWSPRLQQFLDLPEWKEGLKRGYRQERRDAVSEGRPFNPSEYSIVGEDEHGDPIVGAVPTMKLLQVAREGMAAKVDDLRDPLTGRLSKEGRSMWLNLQAFEQEGFRLNPDWKVANDAWSGASSSIRALQLGKKIYAMPIEELGAEFNALSASDKELFRLGAADTAVDKLRRAPKEADPAKRVGNTTDERMRLRMLFDNPEDFNRMMGQVERERLIFDTPREVMKGSQTAERMASDQVGAGLDLAHGAGSLLAGNAIPAIRAFLRSRRDLGVRQNPAFNLEVAKALTDPSITLADTPEVQRWATQILGRRMAPSRGGLKVGEIPREFTQ